MQGVHAPNLLKEYLQRKPKAIQAILLKSKAKSVENRTSNPLLSNPIVTTFPLLPNIHHGPYSKPLPFPIPDYSPMFSLLTLHLSTASSSLPFPLLAIICRHGPLLIFTSISDYWLIMLTLLSPISCTILQLAVAGLSQAFSVFNLSYVQRLSLRLDLLYQYQAIASEVPCDRYTTDSSTCEPSILRPIAWLHQIPLSHARCCDFVHLETRQAGLTDTWLTLTQYPLLTRIWLWLHLELGCNIRSSLSEPSCTDQLTLILIDYHWSRHLDRPTSILTTTWRLSMISMNPWLITLIWNDKNTQTPSKPPSLTQSA